MLHLHVLFEPPNKILTREVCFKTATQNSDRKKLYKQFMDLLKITPPVKPIPSYQFLLAEQQWSLQVDSLDSQCMNGEQPELLEYTWQSPFLHFSQPDQLSRAYREMSLLGDMIQVFLEREENKLNASKASLPANKVIKKSTLKKNKKKQNCDENLWSNHHCPTLVNSQDHHQLLFEAAPNHQATTILCQVTQIRKKK